MNERKRHGFTSFWLILNLISYVLSGISYVLSPQILSDYWVAPQGLVIIYWLASMAGIAGVILLLRWKKLGFWVFLGTAVVAMILNMLIELGLVQILSSIIGIAIMWGVLHLRKNGKTTWEQLD